MLLAIDTSTRAIGIALYDGARVLAESFWYSQDFHTVELAPAVNNVLRKTGVDVTQLGVLAVALGPGSFTGLRIGLAFAKGIAFVNRVPLIGVRTLDILAASQPVVEMPLAAVLRAGRGRLAVGWYRGSDQNWQPEGAMEVVQPRELLQRIQAPTLVCGELSVEEQQMLVQSNSHAKLATPARSVRRPAFLAELGWRRFLDGKFDDPATLAPIYLRYQEPVLGK